MGQGCTPPLHRAVLSTACPQASEWATLLLVFHTLLTASLANSIHLWGPPRAHTMSNIQGFCTIPKYKILQLGSEFRKKAAQR